MVNYDARLIQRAAQTAVALHASQRRRYLDEAYVVHPARVATLTMAAGLDEHAIAAAWLHDVVEDTRDGAAELAMFPVAVRSIVLRLSRSTAPDHATYYARIVELPDAATIKTFDRADNLRDMARASRVVTGHHRDALRLWSIAYLAKTKTHLLPVADHAVEGARVDLLDAIDVLGATITER